MYGNNNLIRNKPQLRTFIRYLIRFDDAAGSNAIKEEIKTYLAVDSKIVETRKILQDELTCAICLDLVIGCVKTVCDHLFCQLCLSSIEHPACPVCRTSLATSTPKILRKIDVILDSVVQRWSEIDPEYVISRNREVIESFCKSCAFRASSEEVQQHDNNMVDLGGKAKQAALRCVLVRKALAELPVTVQNFLDNLSRYLPTYFDMCKYF